MITNMSTVVTGATGFIGRRLLQRLEGHAHAVSMAAADWERRLAAAPLEGAVVYHLAARVHRSSRDDESRYHHDNTVKTVAVADAAVRAGARTFVFLSTVKVLGEESTAPLSIDAPYNPMDAYARSKCAAEEALLQRHASGIPLVIVRMPLVYGPGARGNLARLRHLCDSPYPLPFAAVDNRRSWIHVDDLVDLLMRCGQPAAHGARILHAAHPMPISTPQLVTVLRAALRRPARLFSMPRMMLESTAALVGAGTSMRRLTRSLELDVSASLRAFDWAPCVTLERAAADLVTDA